MENQRAPLRILLTDDDEGDRLVFQEIFEEIETDTIVHTVNDGEQLMGYLKKNTPLPDIIFLDLNMADMNGIECLKEIRGNDRYSNISIAIYSTSSSEKDIEETFLCGANIYITKPADYRELKKVLAKSLSAVRMNKGADFKRTNFVLKI
jgi:CheY-like chemotaxis protein